MDTTTDRPELTRLEEEGAHLAKCARDLLKGLARLQERRPEELRPDTFMLERSLGRFDKLRLGRRMEVRGEAEQALVTAGTHWKVIVTTQWVAAAYAKGR